MNVPMCRPFLTLWLVLLAGTSACAVRSDHEFSWETRPGAASGRAAIEERARRFSDAYVRGDGDAMADLYTTDAVIYPDGAEAIRGREAIRRYWTSRPGERITRHRVTSTEIRIDGDHAYDHGVYEVAGVRNGTPWGPYRGRYVIVWRRVAGGWRMHLDMWSALPRTGG